MPAALPEAKRAVPNEQKILEHSHKARFYAQNPAAYTPSFEYKKSPTQMKLGEVKATIAATPLENILDPAADPRPALFAQIDSVSKAAEEMAQTALTGNEEGYKSHKREFETAITATNRALDTAIQRATELKETQLEDALKEQKANLKKQNLVNDYLSELARDAQIEHDRNYQRHLLEEANPGHFNEITHEKSTVANPVNLLQVAAGKNTITLEDGIWTDQATNMSCMVKRDDKGKVWGSPHPAPNLTNKDSFINAYSVVIDTMLRGSTSDEIFIGPLDPEYVGKGKANYVSEVANWIGWYLEMAVEKNRPLNVKNLFDFFNQAPESAWDPQRIADLRAAVAQHNERMKQANDQKEANIKRDFELNKHVHKLREDGKRAEPNPPGDDEAKRRAWEAKGVADEYKALSEGLAPAAQDAKLIPVDSALRRIETTAPIDDVKNIQTQVNQDLAELASLKDRYKLLKGVVDNNSITLPQPPPDIKAELKAIEQSIAVMGTTVLRKQEEVKNATERRIKNEALIDPKIADFTTKGRESHAADEKKNQEDYNAVAAHNAALGLPAPAPPPQLPNTPDVLLQRGVAAELKSAFDELSPSGNTLLAMNRDFKIRMDNNDVAGARQVLTNVEEARDKAWVLVRALNKANQGTPAERLRISAYLQQNEAVIRNYRRALAAPQVNPIVIPFTPLEQTNAIRAQMGAAGQGADLPALANYRVPVVINMLDGERQNLDTAVQAFNANPDDVVLRERVRSALEAYERHADNVIARGEITYLSDPAKAVDPALIEQLKILALDRPAAVAARNALAPPRPVPAPGPAPAVVVPPGPVPAAVVVPIDRKKYRVPQAELKDEATYIQHLKTIYPAGITDAALAQQRLADGVAYLQDANGMTQRIADAKTDAELNALKLELDTEFKAIATAYDAEHIRFARFAAQYVGGAGNAAAWDDLIINADTKKDELDQAIQARQVVLAAAAAAPLQPPGPVVASAPAPIPAQGGPGAASASASLNSERPRGPLDSGNETFEEKLQASYPGIRDQKSLVAAKMNDVIREMKEASKIFDSVASRLEAKGDKQALQQLVAQYHIIADRNREEYQNSGLVKAAQDLGMQSSVDDWKKLIDAAPQEEQRIAAVVNAAIQRMQPEEKKEEPKQAEPFTPAEAALIESLKARPGNKDKNLSTAELVQKDIHEQVSILDGSQIHKDMDKAIAEGDKETLERLRDKEIAQFLRNKDLINSMYQGDSPIKGIARKIGMDMKVFDTWNKLSNTPHDLFVAKKGELKGKVDKAIEDITKKQEAEAKVVEAKQAKAAADAAKAAADAEAKKAADDEAKRAADAKAKADAEAKALGDDPLIKQYIEKVKTEDQECKHMVDPKAIAEHRVGFLKAELGEQKERILSAIAALQDPQSGVADAKAGVERLIANYEKHRKEDLPHLEKMLGADNANFKEVKALLQPNLIKTQFNEPLEKKIEEAGRRVFRGLGRP